MISIIIAFLVGFAGALLTYNGVKPFVLFILRFLGLSFLVAFLLGLSWQGKVRKSPRLAVLVDVSESMSPLSSWQDSILAKIRQPRGWKMDKYVFSGVISKFSDLQVKDTGRVTDIERAIGEVPGDALLLLSDGLYNTPKDPMMTAYEKKRPIFVFIPPPKTAGVFDVILRKVSGDKRILEGESARLKATIQVTGSKDYSGKLLISEEDSILKKIKVFVPGGKSEEVETEVTFGRAGAHELTFTLTPVEGERTTENNHRKFAVIVSRGKREAWIVSWHPSPNVATFRNFIENVPGWGAQVLVEVEPGRWEELGKSVFSATLPKDGNPDLWVLFDPSPQFLASLLLKRTTTHIVLYLEDPDERIFPLLNLRRGRRMPRRKYDVTLSAQMMDALGLKEPPDLPPLEEIVGVTPPAGYKPILTAPSWKTRHGPLPIVSLFKEESRKGVLVQAGDLWRLSLWDKSLFQKLFNRLIGEIFKGEGIYSAYTSKTVYFEGEPVQVLADAQSAEGEPLTELTVNLLGLDHGIPLWPAGNGHYESPRLFLSPGSYNLKVVFKKGEEKREKEVSFKITVGSPEVYDVGVDSLFLERLALETGGGVLRSPQDVLSLPSRMPGYQEKVTHSLTKSPFFLLLFVVILGLEWGMRKWKGLP